MHVRAPPSLGSKLQVSIEGLSHWRFRDFSLEILPRRHGRGRGHLECCTSSFSRRGWSAQGVRGKCQNQVVSIVVASVAGENNYKRKCCDNKEGREEEHLEGIANHASICCCCCCCCCFVSSRRVVAVLCFDFDWVGLQDTTTILSTRQTRKEG